MALSEETVTLLQRNTIQYLLYLSEKAPNTTNILKSYYASKFRISEMHTKIYVEKNKNKLEASCPSCCLKLRDASYVIKPESKKSKFANKILKKVQTNRPLTLCQARYYKKNDLTPGNQLVRICNFCKKEVTIKCKKPDRIRVDENANAPVTKVKKAKKKKKDKFCGLQREAVASVQNSKVNNNAVASVQNSKVSSHKVRHTHNDAQNNVNQGNVKNKVIQSAFTKKKQHIKQKQNIKKLSKMLNGKMNLKNPNKNNLAQFLESLNK